ncbi:MAG: cardiolipin synthase, partial [Saprospiraceae bacterium]
TTPSKGLAYILLVFLIPGLGILFYYIVGANHRKSKLYKKKIKVDEQAYPELEQLAIEYSNAIINGHKDSLDYFYPLANLLKDKYLISDNNKVELLINGEQKFPKVLESLRQAKHHIHIEYYIYENDDIGNQIADILVEKAKAGVEVRFIYDDFGSRKIRKKKVEEMLAAGVEAFPFYKINFIQFANRVNYRNHRKIIVIDGIVGYIGGINVSDRYINKGKNKLYWRDTHLKIEGTAALNLQLTFLTDWNFCSEQDISFSTDYFPIDNDEIFDSRLVQIITSGPDSDYQSIMYSYIKTILLAKQQLLITTPYFIPDKSFFDALKIAALSGVDVKLLVPGVSDSWIVNTTSQSYYEELLSAGIKLYKYNKGFVHAKTMVCDNKIAIVGTTNLDNRSFDLNFEINAIVYNADIANELAAYFKKDLKYTEQITLAHWIKRPKHIQLAEKVLQLFSPLM